MITYGNKAKEFYREKSDNDALSYQNCLTSTQRKALFREADTLSGVNSGCKNKTNLIFANGTALVESSVDIPLWINCKK